jgi:hypothetical protein
MHRRKPPPLRDAPLLSLPRLALALSVSDAVLRDLCIANRIRPYRAYDRGQERISFAQAERLAALLSESAGP